MPGAPADPDTLVTAPWRSPSFRDLQRTCAFLQGRLTDALSQNEALTSQLEALRAKSRAEATLAGRLMQDVEASASSARVSEAAFSRESAQRREADIEAASLRQTAEQQAVQLREADAREERIFGELADSREGVERARTDVSDLRADNAGLNEALRQCRAEREEALAQLAATQTQLSARNANLASERDALAASRNEANHLRQQCVDAGKALQAARASNAALLNGLKQREEEAAVLTQKCQEAAADALGESEARTQAERTVFALRVQMGEIAEQTTNLQSALKLKEKQNAEARNETRKVGEEAHALTIRMGLFKSVLRSDLEGIVSGRKLVY